MTVREWTILVAASDAAGQAMLAAPVAAAGYAVALADATDAAARVRRVHPDAVVLDMTRLAPDAGVDLVRSIRAETERPLLAVVAPYDNGVGPAALDAGADDFLRSPLAAPELRARLQAHLRPRHGR